jgi:hypothetical protein
MFKVFTNLLNLFVANPDIPLVLSDLPPYWSVLTVAMYPISFRQGVHIVGGLGTFSADGLRRGGKSI